MKRYVRVYVEGGAEGKPANGDFRRGWKTFLNELHELAREKGYASLEVVRGKNRSNAFRRFKGYRTEHPNDLCVLLVDAETAVPKHTGIWDVVARRTGDRWQRPSWATEGHLYLMVHFVETRLLTDQDALQNFFGPDFNRTPLPTTNLEARPKDEIQKALKKATKNSSKGPYRHGQAHEIIGMVDPDKVKKLGHGRRLFDSLSNLIRNEAKTR